MLFDGLAFVSCSPSPFRWTESTRLTELWAVLESRLQGQYLSTKGEQVGSFRVVLHLARCRHDPTFNQALARHHEAKAETCLRTPKCAIPAEWISQFSLISLRYRLVPRVTTSGDWLGTGFGISCLRCCCTCVLECSVCERAGPVVRPFSFPPIKSTELTEFTEFQVGRAKLRLSPICRREEARAWRAFPNGGTRYLGDAHFVSPRCARDGAQAQLRPTTTPLASRRLFGNSANPVNSVYLRRFSYGIACAYGSTTARNCSVVRVPVTRLVPIRNCGMEPFLNSL